MSESRKRMDAIAEHLDAARSRIDAAHVEFLSPADSDMLDAMTELANSIDLILAELRWRP